MEPSCLNNDIIGQLKIKKMPKPKTDIHIQFKNREQEEKKSEETPDIIMPADSEQSELGIPIIKKKHTILFKDITGDVVINRNKILDRIRKNQPQFKIPKQKQVPIAVMEEVPIAEEPIAEEPIAEVPIAKKPIAQEEDEESDTYKDIEQESVDKIMKPTDVLEPPKKVAKEKEPDIVIGTEKQIIKRKPAPAVTKKIYENYTFDANAKINKKLVVARLPKKERFAVRTSDYYMNNRKMYIQKIAELFRPYKKEILENAENASCDTQGSKVNFKLLTHQKVVRDYLNTYTPYRGLLLYHGLGSGKTCTSIAIAEGMKSNRKIIIMTPASLQMNFYNEIKKCGDIMYKKNQYWEFISIVGNPDYVNILSNVLHISKEEIIKKNGAWLVDVTKKTSNYETLTTEQQNDIDKQLNMMIQEKYEFINYNGGLTMAKWLERTNGNTINYFDNSTVLIEEAHNFVSRIVNKVTKRDSLSYMLYDALMRANNVKIILLTGTPIVNYPNELGILFNILRGYIRQWTLQLNIKSSAREGFKLNKDTIMKILDRERFNTYDYIEYSGNKLTITRNPYGFININKRDKRDDADKRDDKRDDKRNDKRKGGAKTKKKISEKAKPKVSNRKTKKIDPFIKIEKNMIQLNPPSEESEPLQLEETIEYNNRINLDPHKGGGIEEDYGGVELDDTGNISDVEFIRTLKQILSDNHIEIVEAGSNYQELKALPDDSENFLNNFVDTENTTIRNENMFKKRILGLTSYFRSAQESLLPRFVKTESGEHIHIVPIEMSDHQFTEYSKIRKEEAEIDKANRMKQQKIRKKGQADLELFKAFSTYRVFSRSACNFVFPDPPGKPSQQNRGKLDDDEEDQDDEPDMGVEEDFAKSYNYNEQVRSALQFLKYNPDKPPEDQYLTLDKLGTYSPKFVKILENVMDAENRGLHLIYSQLRTIEGIELLKLSMEANGFAEFKIKKNKETKLWEVDVAEEDLAKPKFALHTGTETVEEKEIIRNIFNSSWENVPASITAVIRPISSNNFYGEIVKILMITASGREGINLRNTRFVHIVEPYWNIVSVEQAIGRARRICSHQDLVEADRTVKVFMYVSVFSEIQKTNKQNIELMNRDTSRIDERPITTDESLLDTSIIKNNINQKLLDAVKSTAMDCSLYSSGNKEEKIVCYGFGKITSNDFASYPSIDLDKGELEGPPQKIKLKKTQPIDGVVYAVDSRNMNLYSLESYEQAQKGEGELELVGKLEKVGRRYVVNPV